MSLANVYNYVTTDSVKTDKSFATSKNSPVFHCLLPPLVPNNSCFVCA